MIILNSLLCTSIIIYHESRSEGLSSQLLVGNSVYTRAIDHKIQPCDEIFRKGSYSSMIKYPRKNKFKDFDSFMKYYGLNDYSSWVLASQAANISSDYFKARPITYFHDKSIKNFNWNAGQPVVTTKNLKFYN